MIDQKNEILALDVLNPTEGNPQKMTAAEFDGLVNSIRTKGFVLDDPVVRKHRNKYQIISGHHRIAAAAEAGITELNCKIISGVTDRQARLLVVESNKRRGNLDEDLLKKYLENVLDDFDIDIDAVADDIGMSETNINNILKENEIIVADNITEYITFIVSTKQKKFIEKRIDEMDGETRTDKLINLCKLNTENQKRRF